MANKPFKAKDNHWYTYENGPRLLSFSTLTKWYSQQKYSIIPKNVLSQAAEFGKQLHFLIENRDILPENQQEINCLKAFDNWLKYNQFEVVESELMIWDYRHIGFVDLIVKDKNGKLGIVEIKTRGTIEKNPHKKYWLEKTQSAFYRKVLDQAKLDNNIDLKISFTSILILNKTNGDYYFYNMKTKKELNDYYWAIKQLIEKYELQQSLEKWFESGNE